jgi:excinuclease UvrABC nuclease subunit
MTSSHKNTKKGRESVPEKPGVYNLKNREGETTYTGHSNNVKKRIKQHHADPDKHFASVSVDTKKSKREAQSTEKKRLDKKKPRDNKQT